MVRCALNLRFQSNSAVAIVIFTGVAESFFSWSPGVSIIGGAVSFLLIARCSLNLRFQSNSAVAIVIFTGVAESFFSWSPGVSIIGGAVSFFVDSKMCSEPTITTKRCRCDHIYAATPAIFQPAMMLRSLLCSNPYNFSTSHDVAVTFVLATPTLCLSTPGHL